MGLGVVKSIRTLSCSVANMGCLLTRCKIGAGNDVVVERQGLINGNDSYPTLTVPSYRLSTLSFQSKLKE